jgi:serine phosphatase RsbU (regulator of sigma subunit)
MRCAASHAVNFMGDCLIINPRSDAAWDLGCFRLLAKSRSAEGELGGDFYAFRQKSPDRLSVMIGDVCGRGREGAHLLPSVLARVEEVALGPGRPSHLLADLNRSLAHDLSSDRFVTVMSLEIDAERGTLTVANAGHVPLMLRRASGDVRIIGRASGPPLGIWPDSSHFDETYRFKSGDLLVLMTDGILEAIETDLEGMSRLKALLAVAQDAGAVHRRLFEQLLREREERVADDMTLLSLELLRDPETLSRRELLPAA